MDFGRLKNIEQVNFSLPVDHEQNKKILNREYTTNAKVYVGCPIWADSGWVGKIYPDDAQEKHYLRYYAHQFNCIELNATHYKIPSISTVNKWKSMVNNDFKFCPKVPQVISHAKNILEYNVLMTEFIDAIISFDNFLGVTFLQLPPHFASNRLEELITFLSLIQTPIKLAVELRHESWFTDKKAFDELSEFLMECNYSLVITDVAGRRDVLHQRLTNKTTFIRFGAHDMHASDFKRIDDWVERILYWAENGLEEIYFFVHTSDKSLCPELANYFIHQFNKKGKIKLKPIAIKQEAKQVSMFLE